MGPASPLVLRILPAPGGHCHSPAPQAARPVDPLCSKARGSAGVRGHVALTILQRCYLLCLGTGLIDTR